jgi:hypothetical protein
MVRDGASSAIRVCHPPAQRRDRLILTMPETMSCERRALVTRFRALKEGGTQPFALGLSCSIVAALVALLYVWITS